MVRTDRRRWLALTLVLSLLFTQWLGLAHAVAHGSGMPEYRPLVLKTAGLFDHQKSSGTCAALDDAALGAGVSTSSFVPALLAFAEGPAIVPLRAGRDRPFTAHFSSRAPPLND